MPKKVLFATAVLCALAFLLSGQRPPRATARRVASAAPQGMLRDAALEQRVREAFSASPLRFEENVGQTDSRVKFVARGSNFMLFLTPQEAAMRIHTPHVREKLPPQLASEGESWADALNATSVVRVEFAGGNPAAKLTGLDAQPGTINYITGSDPNRWQRNVPHFGRVRYESIYPGIDALFYGDRRQMEYDFVVAPGADPSAIRMRVEGASNVVLTAEGGVEARTPAGTVNLLPPKLYQERDGTRPEIAGRYVWRAPGEIGFEVAQYDGKQALVIDPRVNVAGHVLASPPPGPPPSSPPPTGSAVALSTMLGGSGDDSIQAIAIGATGHVYVAGFTDSGDFPVVGGFAPNTFHGSLFNSTCSLPQFPCGDVFVAEFDVSTISAPVLVASTYLGGSGDEAAWGMALDASDNVYLVGETDSGDFPTNGLVAGFQPTAPLGGCSTNGTLRACHHAFFTQLDPTLSTLMYSTYLAGTDDDEGYAIALNATGQVFLTGVAGPNFPLTDTAFQSNYNGGGDVFVSEIDPAIAGNSGGPSGFGGLIYSTYVGGDGTDVGFTIAVNSSNNAIVGGVTFSTITTTPMFTPLMTTLSVQPNTNDLANCGPGFVFTCGDGFVFRLDPANSTIPFSTWLGGSFSDQVNALVLDASGNVYATGQTQSSDFQPVSLYAGTRFQNFNNGGYDAFVVSFSPFPDSGIKYSTYLGGSNDDFGLSIAVDSSGDAFVAGSTASGATAEVLFPIVNALQASSQVQFFESTGFVSVLNPTGTAPLLFSTFYGGSVDRGGFFSADTGEAIALDSTGRVYLGGRTNSVDICLINQVPGASNDTNSFADFNAYLTIINPTNTAAACFSPALPTTLLFASTLVGKMSGTQGPTIFNQGSGTLTTSSVTFTGANPTDFPVQTNTCASVPSGGSSCFIGLAFAPKTAMAESATLVITNNSAGSPYMVNLQGTGLPPAQVSLSPASPFNFPDTFVNQPSLSPVQKFTLTNLDIASPLTIASTSITGTNQSDFAIQLSSTCTPGTVVPPDVDASCTINVIFLPSATGARTATLTVTDDGAGSPRKVTLNGNGILPPPIATVPPLTLTFAPQGQGTTSTAQTVTITNGAAAGASNLNVASLTFVGGNNGDFAVVPSSTCIGASVPPSGMCTISVTFTPTATGPRSSTLNIADNAPNTPQMIGVSGTGLAAPTATPSGTVTFPPQVTNTTSAPMNVTLANSGGSALGITSISLTTGNAGDFAIFSNGCGTSLGAGTSCVVALTFTPTATGARTTMLQFMDNAAGSPQNVTINGTGATGPTAALTPSPTLTFVAAQLINTTSASQPAMLTNSGGAPLSITSIVATGDFAVLSSSCGTSLAANSACPINITFTPTAAGARNGTLTVMDAVGTQMINLAGTGVTPPTATLSTNSVMFGIQAVGVTSAAMPVTVTNNGGSQLNFTTIAPSGDFSETDNCLPSVAANGGFCTIMVTFTPSGVGVRNGSIVILDNAANSPQTIMLSGTGSSSVPGFNLSAPLFFGAVLTGSTSPAQTITITNSGGAPLTITSAMASGDFAVSANTCGNVPIGQSCMISVTFSPTATGARMGTLTIMDNSPGNPHNVQLSGIGATITIAPPAGGSTTLTVTPGDTAQYALNVTGTQGLVVTLNLACSSAAPNTRCSVSPSTVTLGGPNAPSVLVTVLTNCNPAMLPWRPTGPAPILPAPFAALWVGTAALYALLRRCAPQSRLLSRAAPVLLLLLLVVTWAGCVNNAPPAIPGAPTTPAGTYNVTVTASGMNVTKQLVLTLRVI